VQGRANAAQTLASLNQPRCVSLFFRPGILLSVFGLARLAAAQFSIIRGAAASTMRILY